MTPTKDTVEPLWGPENAAPGPRQLRDGSERCSIYVSIYVRWIIEHISNMSWSWHIFTTNWMWRQKQGTVRAVYSQSDNRTVKQYVGHVWDVQLVECGRVRMVGMEWGDIKGVTICHLCSLTHRVEIFSYICTFKAKRDFTQVIVLQLITKKHTIPKTQ